MKIGLIGKGMVGSAMNHLFPEAKVYDIDPKKSNATKEDINKCEVVFVCVPTDGNDYGYNYDPLVETIDWLDVPLIVIKSTIEPFTTRTLIENTGRNIVFNPEFLREKTRFKDIENETRIIIGTNKKENFEKLRDVYLDKYDHDKVDIVQTTPEIAEFVKIINNSYFANKVIFCNQIKEILDAANVDYDKFLRAWLLEPRVGKNHTLVTGEGGFGGYCLPKDERALISTARKLGVEPNFLIEIWNANCQYRDEFEGQEYE